jgi:intracellular sulfur oxidation DsrE/DsrF family protein
MKNIMLIIVLFISLLSNTSYAQQTDTKEHKVVMQLTTGDTLAYRALVKQLGNMTKIWPNAKIEVVIHNKGIAMMKKESSNVAEEITTLTKKGVRFVVCEFTMEQLKLEKSQILNDAYYTPYGLIAIVTKQEEGYAYLKAGF